MQNRHFTSQTPIKRATGTVSSRNWRCVVKCKVLALIVFALCNLPTIAFAGTSSARCNPISGLTQILWGFPMSQAEYDNGLFDGPTGDYPWLSYTSHDAYFLNYVCHKVYYGQGGGRANCVYDEQLAQMTPPDGQAADPYGWNLFYAGCGTACLDKSCGR